MKEIKLRPFAPADQSAVAALLHAGLAQRFGVSYDPQFNTDVDDIPTYYPNETVIVAEEEGEIVACGMLVHENGSDDIGRIVRVSVRADQQGKGLGRRISQHLIDLGREQGFTQLLVETNSDWHSALRLYQSCGFVEYERRVEAEFGFTEVHMRLDFIVIEG